MKQWIAHRGNNNHSYHENTKEALLKALETPYIAGVELDVRMTKDKQIVIIHNPTISATSNGFGIVKYMTLQELEQYNFGNVNQVSKICTLKSFLKDLKTSKIIMIEAKEYIVEPLFQVIHLFPQFNFYICSFDYTFVSHFKKKYPQYKVGLIMGDMINHNKDVTQLDFVSTKDITYSHSKETFYWGLRDEQIKKLKKAFIITDKAYYYQLE